MTIMSFSSCWLKQDYDAHERNNIKIKITPLELIGHWKISDSFYDDIKSHEWSVTPISEFILLKDSIAIIPIHKDFQNKYSPNYKYLKDTIFGKWFITYGAKGQYYSGDSAYQLTFHYNQLKFTSKKDTFNMGNINENFMITKINDRFTIWVVIGTNKLSSSFQDYYKIK